ncbi:uncharacterized protein PAC_18449 [Phialocephala subalpina]|uniref:Gfd2/YDR514C-like C-terminal domain-containing protein n=1 Tax=Phialocephala subalpina TaxID=576137 RepID=A0A1L7XU57_9HELO|nr:uncharacterized protein PAC_18449 [Phialocephala subalpina]
MSLLDTIKTALPGATKDQQKFSQKNVPEKAKVWQRLAEVVQNARSSLPPEELKVFDAILDPTTKIMPTLSCLPQQTTSISSTVATVKPSWGLKAYSSDAIAATPALDSASSSSISDTSSVKGLPASSVTSGSTSVDIPAVWNSLPAIFEHDSTRSTPPKSSTGESGHTGPHAPPGVTKELIKYMQDAFEPPGGFDVAKDLNLLRYELPKRTSFQDLQKAAFNEQIPVARQCLGLSRSLTTEQNTKVTPDRLKDAVLVCIDFENGPSVVENPKSTKLYSQMGVCIFDARVLSSRSDFDPERVLETYNFSTRNTEKWRDQLFIFGKTEETTLKGLYSKLDELLDRSRNNILIGHDVEHEIAVINALGFDIDARFSAILDTQDMMKWLWLPEKYKQVKYPPRHVLDVRLESLLSRIGVEFADLHIGGNDANFTLKAFLLLWLRA